LSRPRIEKVQHVIRIESWNFDYTFGINDLKYLTGPYSDYRHLKIRGAIVQPTSIKAREAEVTCFPDIQLMESNLKPTDKARPPGNVAHWGKDYSASLHMPADALPLVLQMLIAGRYRFVVFEAAKSFRGEAPIFYFRFSEALDDD
jgi:hypothetical protein